MNIFSHVKTCVTCAHLHQTMRPMTSRTEYTCGRTNSSAYDERRGSGECGPEGTEWAKK